MRNQKNHKSHFLNRGVKASYQNNLGVHSWAGFHVVLPALSIKKEVTMDSKKKLLEALSEIAQKNEEQCQVVELALRPLGSIMDEGKEIQERYKALVDYCYENC